MATATVKYLGGLRTECTHLASGATIITDAPVDNHGKGEAFSPTDMCAVSLGTCAITIMGIYAQNNGLDITGATVEVTKTMGIAPRRISQIDVVIRMPNKTYSDETKKILEKEALNCPVCHSLHPDIQRNISIIWA